MNILNWIVFLNFLLCAGVLSAGELTARYELTLDRVLRGGPPAYTDDFVLADAVPQHVRRFTEFSGDVSGRYIGALAIAAQFSGKDFPELDRVVGKLVKLQKEDGHFGEAFSDGAIANRDMALLWGNGRLLIGLLEYYRVKPSADVLACAKRLADCFVKLGPRLNADAVREQFSGDQVAVGYICWTQIIEGLTALNRITHDESYLRLAEQIAVNTRRHPKQHSHGFATSLRGIVDLYRVTKDAKWLKQVETEWEGILSSGNLLPQGALPEIFKPLIARDEGCAEADWLRLNLDLWGETRNQRYLETAEWALFNEFSFNQFSTGDYGHHKLSDTGIAPDCARAWWCCTFHGLRAFPDVFRAAFRSDPAGLCYDLPVDGHGVSGGLEMQADSTLGQDASVTIKATKSCKEELLLKIRQPAWASALELKLNRKVLAGDLKEGAVAICRQWKKGDTLTVCYVMKTRLIPQPSNPKRIGVVHGPWLLGVNDQDSPTFFDEPSSENRVIMPAAGKDDEVKLVCASEKEAKDRKFTAPAAHLVLEYLPGGYPVQPQHAVLRPMAEHTAIADGSQWVMWFDRK